MSSPPPTIEVPTLPPPSSRFVLPPPSSDLISRLSAFLPQIKQANEQLELDPSNHSTGAEPVTLVPVKAPKPTTKKARRAAAAAAGATGEVPPSESASDSSDDSDSSESSSEDDSDEEESSEGEEIVLVNLGEDALPGGVERLRPIVAGPEEGLEEGGEEGEGLEAGKLGLNKARAGGKPVIEEMEQ